MAELNLLEHKAVNSAFKKYATAFSINSCKFYSFWCRVAEDDKFNLKQHQHSFFELHCCLSGETEIEIEGQNYLLRSGWYLLIPHGVQHRIVRVSEDYSRFVWGVEVGGLKAPARRAVFRSLTDEEKGLLQIINLCASKGSANLSGEIAASLGALFFSLSETSGSAVDNTAKKVEIFALVNRYVRDNLSQIEGIEEVAAQFFLSSRQLSRICEKETGVSFGKHLKQMKMEKAKELLEKHTVRETAELLGFSDEFSFSRSFLKTVGETPAQVRKKKNK